MGHLLNRRGTVSEYARHTIAHQTLGEFCLLFCDFPFSASLTRHCQDIMLIWFPSIKARETV